MSDEYGYFGNGTEGYAHYVAASGDDDSQGGSGAPPTGRGQVMQGVLLLLLF